MSVYGDDELYLDDDITYEQYEAPFPVAPHTHRFIEIAYVVQGTAVYTVDGVSHLVRAGNYILVDYGVVHSYQNPSREFRVDNFLFLPAFIDRTLCSSYSIQDVVDHSLLLMGIGVQGRILSGQIWLDADGTVRALMEKIAGEYSRMAVGYRPMIRGLLIELLLTALREVINADRPEEVAQPDILDMLEWDGLEDGEEHTLRRYAEKWHTSVSTLSRKFKQVMGCGYSDYIRRKRIGFACRLLSNTSGRVSEIAGRVGYQDDKQFSQTFKTVTGMSPSAYRKAFRQQHTR